MVREGIKTVSVNDIGKTENMDNSENVYRARQHALRLFNYTTRYFWLLIIPLARSLYSLSFEIDALRVWLEGAWLDLFVVFAILAFAWLRWMSVWFCFDSEKIVLKRGLFATAEDTVYYSNISTLSINQNVLYRLLGASKVSIGTNAGLSDKADLKIIMRRADADRFYDKVKGSRQKSLNYSILPNKLRLILFSLTFSSALSGVLIIIALLIETGSIFDREVEARLILDTLTEAAKRVSVYVPPVISIMIMILIVSWAISFVSNLFAFWGFVLTKSSDSIYVKSGICAKNRHIIKRDKVNYIDLKQSFSSKVFRVSSLHLNCSGYGSRGRKELSVVLPITTRGEIDGAVKEVFPEYPKPKITLKSNPKSYLGFYFLPIVFAIIPSAAFLVFYYFLPTWYAVAYPAFAITLIPAIWLAMCSTLSMFTTGIGFTDGYITIRYSKMYTFHTVVAPVDRIAKIVIHQSPLQRIGGSCTLIVYTTSDAKARHRIQALRLDKTLSTLEKNGFDLYFNENPE